jgi:hemerythrin-like domain-containing protein
VGALKAVGAAEGTVAERERVLAVETAQAFVPLLRQHIVKEDRILYPMALQMLEPAALDAVETEFERFETTFSAGGEVARLYRLAETLERAFPGDPVRMAGGSLTGCGASR